ncbi:MAG: flagellar biosynthesis protein FliQ [Candidatus Gastranaerophilales bacterium]|nr:flagellar biosynthesis protein FliQ [Candidatus Gastranaerophilales bacterium]
MDQAQLLTLIQSVLVLIMILSAPVLIVSVVVGLIISIFQSVTQIQESTLTFVPKIIAGILTLIVSLPWMMNVFIDHVNDWFDKIQVFIR